MLVLTRKSEEKIVIGKKNQIVITVLKIQGDKVSIGIEAPEDEPIMRKELLLRDPEKNRERNQDNDDKQQDKETLLRLKAETHKKRNPSMSLPGRKPEPHNDSSEP